MADSYKNLLYALIQGFLTFSVPYETLVKPTDSSEKWI